jgi:hypothetical protein
LIDDALQGAFSEFGVIRNRNCDSSLADFFAQDSVTTLLSDFHEAMLLQNSANLTGRSLGMREFQILYLNASIQSSTNFSFARFLDQKLNRFLKHQLCFVVGSPLAGDA